MAEEEPVREQEEALHPPEENGGSAAAPAEGGGGAGEATVNLELRPVFLGNLKTGYSATEVTEIFNRPIVPPNSPEGKYGPVPVDRVDLKRGYCFVFLKDATSQAHKDMAELFVSDINGM